MTYSTSHVKCSLTILKKLVKSECEEDHLNDLTENVVYARFFDIQKISLKKSRQDVWWQIFRSVTMYSRIKRSTTQLNNSTNQRRFGTIQNMENNLLEDMPNQEEFDFRIELLSIDAIQRKARISFIDQWTFTQYVKSRLLTTLKVKSKNKDYIFIRIIRIKLKYNK